MAFLWMACQQQTLSKVKSGIPILNLGYSALVGPMGERSYYDVEDFHKILEFTGLIEPFTH